MRLRHVLLTCVTLPLLATAIHPARADAVDGQNLNAYAATSPVEVEASRAAVRRMAEQLDLGFREFTLANGLRVMVYSDHGTPIVHVGIWYDVGSKHEPAGRSGFAHLFEHLMFNGSQNVPGDYLPRLVNVGGEVNGNTSVDRTHYYETVPTPALDRALFMESDRMGHLLGGLSQATLDRQRGVVQNEKRNGSSAASAVVSEMKRAALYPAAHPYGHSVIGSMKDLNAATLNDVGAFFKEHYGPNNALLVLSGDVDLETARRLVTKYFGDIPAGPRNVRPNAAPVMLTKTLSQTTTAPVTAPLVVRAWPVPGVDNNEALALNVAAVTMAGMPGSPFYRHLVEEQKLFQSVSAANNSNAQAGDFTIGGSVRPGVDPKVAAAALDRELALFLKQGVSPDLMTQWIATNSYESVRGLEVPSVRASSVGEGMMLSGRPDALKADLRFYAGLTPSAVTAVARKWLARPRWELIVTPGPRVIPKDDAGIDGSSPTNGGTDGTQPAVATTASEVERAAQAGNRGPVPDVGPPAEIRFPRIEHAKLANGIPLIYARWSRTPFTRLGLIVEGGALNEPADQTGTLNVMYSLLAKSFAGMSEDSVRRRLNLTGVSLSSGSGWSDGFVSLDTSDANLMSALTMMHQTLVAPTFPAELIERMKQDMRDGRVSSRLDPQTLTREAMMPLLDAGSPYNRLQMYGDGKAYQRITRDGVLAAWHRWLRPEHAFMTVVSDKPLAELLPMLDRSIGAWRVAGPPEPVPDVVYQPRPGKPEIVLIDLPGAVQASITGGQWVPATDRDPIEALNLGDSIFGATNTSRLYTNLRDSKHWTYGANGSFDLRRYSSSYSVTTDVQQDKAGPAIGEMMEELRGIVGRRPITAAELDREKTTKLGLAGRIYSDGGSVAGALQEVQERGLPDDYQAKIAARIRAVTLDDVNRAMRSQLDPSQWSWVIVGNASIIRPQLDGLGLPVRVVKAADVLPQQ